MLSTQEVLGAIRASKHKPTAGITDPSVVLWSPDGTIVHKGVYTWFADNIKLLVSADEDHVVKLFESMEYNTLELGHKVRK